MAKRRGTYRSSGRKRIGGSNQFFNRSVKTEQAREKGFRSGFENTIAKQFERRGVDPKEVYEVQQHEYTIPEKPKKYLIDFIIPGTNIAIEAKGRMSPTDREKILNCIRCNPQIDFRIVFQNPNIPINKGAVTTYGSWASKNGIKWANKIIPNEWFEEGGHKVLKD